VKPFLGWALTADEADEDPNSENPDPDLYGPIWITTTLVLSLSVGSNVAHFFHSLIHMADADQLSGEHLYSGLEFQRLWVAAVILYGYVFLVPLLLMVLQPCTNVKVPLVNTICVYGYALSPVVIASIVCMVPSALVQLIALASAFVLSTWFVMFNVWRHQTVESRSLAYSVKLLSGALHVVLGAVVTYLFFRS